MSHERFWKSLYDGEVSMNEHSQIVARIVLRKNKIDVGLAQKLLFTRSSFWNHEKIIPRSCDDILKMNLYDQMVMIWGWIL